MKTHVITIGIPPATLSPNARVHWAAVAQAKKALRRKVADVVAIQHKDIEDAMWKSATIQYKFYFKENRKRDDDNFAARMKAARDALGPPTRNKDCAVNGAGASVVADDCGFTQLPTEMHTDPENPRVEIHITNTTETTNG
jgi:hypothetical protein